jgi:hypothetical protein
VSHTPGTAVDWSEHCRHSQRHDIQVLGFLDSHGSEVRHVVRRPIFQDWRPQGVYRILYLLGPRLCSCREVTIAPRLRLAKQLLGGVHVRLALLWCARLI